ncbi:mechanosensitive ion channel family protein [Mycetocola reblochoni]|uniref:Potassium efflux system KefA protein / Small-conductance mechanosensitive channel n=2 Tax=Mycetocola reblochoni TaxID=331618 RepID=A0A1R4JDS1_9MICO|nr:mechanosensitive ion channel family protein [Mycetocola reblochoni]RLP69947.1 mechanosensitive ion channel family protein [Mycetocola reblochoni]SJN29955.1 Potassium efflux system KefA protein / Small-conductance mechanosensitive channel [Mycetocola reblochoni REB411]
MDEKDVADAVTGFFDSPLGIAVHVAIAIVATVVLIWLLHFVIQRVVDQIVNGVKKTQGAEDTQALNASPLATVRVVQRTRTIGSVLTNIVNVVVVVVAVAYITELLAPNLLGSLSLLTAAVGAGLGFGAQNIVKDVFNGLFMVMEDQLGVGDVVNVNVTGSEVAGVVERVGVRVSQIRDVNGTLWYIRNGEVIRLGNMSQGWTRIIIDTAIPYSADVDDVQEKMLATAVGMSKEPKWRNRVIDKPELWGIQSISEDNIVLRLVMRTRTSAKDDASRELRSRLKHTLDELGVQPPSLAAVALAGIEDVHSVTGAHPPRTRPVSVVNEAPRIVKPRKGKRQ